MELKSDSKGESSKGTSDLNPNDEQKLRRPRRERHQEDNAEDKNTALGNNIETGTSSVESTAPIKPARRRRAVESEAAEIVNNGILKSHCFDFLIFKTFLQDRMGVVGG
jgi:hypothetical protein